jgi:hypothetical protein
MTSQSQAIVRDRNYRSGIGDTSGQVAESAGRRIGMAGQSDRDTVEKFCFQLLSYQNPRCAATFVSHSGPANGPAAEPKRIGAQRGSRSKCTDNWRLSRGVAREAPATSILYTWG